MKTHTRIVYLHDYPGKESTFLLVFAPQFLAEKLFIPIPEGGMFFNLLRDDTTHSIIGMMFHLACQPDTTGEAFQAHLAILDKTHSELLSLLSK